MFVFELIFGHCMSSTLTATIFLQTPHAVIWLLLSFRSRDLHQRSVTLTCSPLCHGVVHRLPVLRHLFPQRSLESLWSGLPLIWATAQFPLSFTKRQAWALSFPGNSQVTSTLSRGRAPWVAPECHFGRCIMSAALLLMGLPMNL